MNPARRPTSADVARRAGVSRATVSYVLNDKAHQSIPEATRRRVLAAATELDYSPHAAARTLRAGESRLVLFINAGTPYGANLGAIIDTLSAEAAASGRSLVTWQQQDPGDLAATLAHLQPAMAITLGRLNEAQRNLLARARIPGVEDDSGQDPDAADTGAALQIRHLASRGHRQLGYLTAADPKLGLFARPRLAGARSSSAQLGLDLPAVAEFAAPPGLPLDHLSAVLQAWTRRPDPVTAVACYNDEYAMACLAAARQAGLSVPTDLAVIGMDDDPVSGYTKPALTTIRLHVADFARHLWTRASTVLDGAPAPEHPPSLLVSLVQRQST